MIDARARQSVIGAMVDECPTFSPDGLWVAYQSDESGRYEIYVQPYPGPGGKRQISSEGGESPVWSGDGSEIFFRSGDRMMSAEVSLDPLQLGRPRELFRGVFSGGYAIFRGYDVSADGQSFLMVQRVDTAAEAEPLIVVLNWPELLEWSGSPSDRTVIETMAWLLWESDQLYLIGIIALAAHFEEAADRWTTSWKKPQTKAFPGGSSSM